MAIQRTDGRAADAGALLTLRGISKSFGPVQALKQVDLELRGGELLGLVGHNGAGKSTLMNILIGVTSPDRGEIILESQAMDERYGPAMAHRLGIRCVFQELSLCPNLSAVENALIVHPSLEGTGWKRRAKSVILTKLHEIFPDHGIDVQTPVGSLPIGQRQMVEIARAFTESNNAAKLVILDEPTSSLDSSAAQQLLRFLRRTVTDGKACILITHKLTEVLNFAQRVVVMKDAGVVADVSGSGLSRERLFTLMGSVERAMLLPQASSFAGVRRVDVAGEVGRPSELRIEAGETVGLAGLAGHGQKEVLHRIYAASRGGRDKGCKVTGSAAYVSGDRQREGIFPLWSIASNITIASVRSLSRGSFINPAREQHLAEAWREKISIRSKSVFQSILSLSGGNRQKALVARAFATNAEIILFDDPTRGVDFDTKRELYSQIESAARSGRCFVWYTTETDELFLCDRVYVFHEGKVVDSLARSELSEERLLQASFHEA